MTVTSPLPPAAPQVPDLAGRRRGTLVAVAAAAVAIDLMLTTALAGWAAFGAVAAIVAALGLSGRLIGGHARFVVGAALAPALFLALRASPWVVVLDVLAVAGLLAVGAALGPGGDLFDTRFATLARQAGSIVVAALVAPAALVQTVAAAVPRPTAPEGGRRQLAAFGRGLALAVPIMVVLVVALASGDAVFASLVSVDLEVGPVLEHVVHLLLGLWLACTVLAQAGRARQLPPSDRRALFGPLEGSTVLGGLILVYALFALARLLVALKGDAYVLETTGLTYAEYARSGFFQLLGAAALTVTVLLGLRSTVNLPTTASRRTFAVLAALAVVLTLVMVQSATIRLSLYDAAFGATMLRLYSTIFAWWVGAVLVLVGLALCGLVPGRSWLPGAVAASALAVLLAVNVMDPERLAVSRNLDRYRETGRIDLIYAARDQSPDGRTVLITRRHELSADDQAHLANLLCSPWERAPAPSLNLSARAYADARAELCATG